MSSLNLPHLFSIFSQDLPHSLIVGISPLLQRLHWNAIFDPPFNNQDCSLSFDSLCFSRSLIVYFIIFFLVLWLFSTCLSISCELFHGRKSPNLCFIWNIVNTYWINYVQFSSVAQSCLTLCDPMNHKWVLQSKYIKMKFLSPVHPGSYLSLFFYSAILIKT